MIFEDEIEVKLEIPFTMAKTDTKGASAWEARGA
jgi:hypothetical protein